MGVFKAVVEGLLTLIMFMLIAAGLMAIFLIAVYWLIQFLKWAWVG